ncbi:MAG TPA: sugar kinase [Candidatus Hydrogenedentes bacterium]|nr:sugar kinase [Candidatus Hydrogenedentota bacterium]
MSVTVVGSLALDTVETPWGRNEEGLGGSATYFALAAINYTDVNLVGAVGEDFPPEHTQLFERKGVNLDGLERVQGKTFRWTGRYHDDVNCRDTLDTQLNVFEHFHPKLPPKARQAQYLFLGNIHPSLQAEVLDQAAANFTALDTMNLWMDTALDELKAVLRRVDALLINDAEARQLAGQKSLVRAAQAIHALGPAVVVIKKGEHGCLLFTAGHVFAAPALPLAEVRDPTGAGDSFAGGFMGYLARQNAADFDSLRRAVVEGTAVASFACEAFGPSRLADMDLNAIQERVQALRDLTSF